MERITTHSAINKTVASKEYEINKAYVFAPSNIEVQDRIIYYPVYMAAFISDEAVFPELTLPL